MRKLASIQAISSISPIDGADQIEVARVLGWNVVVKKGEFKVGDKCCYVEIDSMMPERPEFEFLRPRGFRIRTVRLKGQVSQGICFPTSILPKDITDALGYGDWIGIDVTDQLGVVKYEPPIPANLGGEVKGHFPSFIPKTDETRIQVLQPILEKYKGATCCIAEKLDGSSVTYFIKDGEFGVCSRNLELKETEGNTLWRVAREMNIEGKLRSLGINCAIQGELIGEGIQKNKYKLKGQSARFFNFFDIDKFEYAGHNEFVSMISSLGLQTVPILSDAYVLDNDIDKLVEMSIGKSALNKDIWREGIVIRPIKETIDHEASNGLLHNDRVSFKVINPNFLLKYEDD